MMPLTSTHESTEWLEMRWLYTFRTEALPRVLLVGDSLVAGHGKMLAEALLDICGIDYLATSRIVSDCNFWPDLAYMLAKRPQGYEAIIFNNGLHNINEDDTVYANALQVVLKRLESFTCKLIWRSCTPTFPDRIMHRNELAMKVVKHLQLPIIDLFEKLNNQELSSDGTHFTETGYKIIVEAEAAVLREYFNA